MLAKNTLLIRSSGYAKPGEVDESNERACLQNTLGEVIDAYTMDQMPAKIRQQLKQSEIEVPLHLCRTNWRKRIKQDSLDSFNFEATTEALISCL